MSSYWLNLKGECGILLVRVASFDLLCWNRTVFFLLFCFFPHFSEYFVFPEWIRFLVISPTFSLEAGGWVAHCLPDLKYSALWGIGCVALLVCVSCFYSLEPLRSCVEGAGILLNCMSYIYEKLKGLWGFSFLVSNLLTALWGRECEVLSPFCRCYNRGIAQLDVGPIANHRLSGKCLRVFSTSISVI